MTAARRGEWRNADPYLPILVGGRQALAWELLRRDPDYVSSFAREHQVPHRIVTAMPECLAQWGLHFRM
jgi:hypothetical protein